MEYLVLLYDDEANGAEPGTPEWDADMAKYLAFGDLAGEAILGGEALEPVATSRTIRHDGGQVLVTDGPFAETTEVLGGYYVLDVPTLDDAIELVRTLPSASTGSIEIRPIEMRMDPGEQPAPEGTDRYLVTIHGAATEADVPGTPEWDAGAAEHGEFVATAGPAMLGGAAVHPSSTASVVRVRDGELLVTDGPFAEAIEVVGGYYLLRAAPDAIVDLAAGIPTPSDGGVDLRPILEMD